MSRFNLSIMLFLLVIAACMPMVSQSAARAEPPTTAPVVSAEQIRVLEGHKFSVEAEDFSADGKTLITGSRDGTIKVWNPQTGELLRTLTEHTKTAAAVTPAASNDPQAAHRGMDVMGLTYSPHG